MKIEAHNPKKHLVVFASAHHDPCEMPGALLGGEEGWESIERFDISPKNYHDIDHLISTAKATLFDNAWAGDCSFLIVQYDDGGAPYEVEGSGICWGEKIQ
jgi:hypothetical protein